MVKLFTSDVLGRAQRMKPNRLFHPPRLSTQSKELYFLRRLRKSFIKFSMDLHVSSGGSLHALVD